ncbi:MAG: hypothetical protein HY298_08635 [Verrucomicrobia bacterium]|nr:hypothetical protein [Verrucomicrobiota bacterium]
MNTQISLLSTFMQFCLLKSGQHSSLRWPRADLLKRAIWLALAGTMMLMRTAVAQPNDNFGSATLIAGSSGAASVSNTNATKEVGEPHHAGNAGGHSVWFRWDATNATPVTFETIGSSFDTLLAIYTGSTVSNLTEVVSNNDIFGTNRWSRAKFTPVSGTTYWIAVDGYNGDSGNVYLHWVQRAGVPDMLVWGPSLNPVISIETFSTSSCAVVEGLIQPGTRKLIRFATESRNYGSADLVLGNPTGNPLFEYSACHGHYHFHDYVAHRLKSDSTVVAVGLKVGHCLLDSIRWDTNANGSAIYNCGNQGIQKGWGDIYRSSLDGQWVDITGVPAGDYTLELEINPDRILDESNYSNNVTQVPFTIPDTTKPQLASLSPTNGATGVSPANTTTAIIVDGTSQVATNTVQLFYDDILVVPLITQNAGWTTIAYTRAGLLDPLSAHTTKLIFADNGSTPTYQTNIATFTIGGWLNKYLPPPLYLETFDFVAEGALPAGWSVTNHTDTDVAGYNLASDHSDAYKDWVVITLARLVTQFPADRRIPGALNVVNGQVLDGLIHTNFIYAASDPRTNSQIQYLFSPDFNLTGQSDIWISYHSIYTQNQDSIGALEYSIDGGTTWLPVVYMLDGPDVILNTNGTVNAVKTLTNVYSDVAVYFDPSPGQNVGGNYGAFIAAPIAQALAPFISSRVNDDQAESKRVELFRLAAADNQPKVRFRFAQAGTDSWYWGIDDFGIYSITDQSPRITGIARSGNDISISWNGEIVSRLQKATSLSNPLWQNVPGTLGLSNFSEPIGLGETYYRLLKQ